MPRKESAMRLATLFLLILAALVVGSCCVAFGAVVWINAIVMLERLFFFPEEED
jgi:hypothetical protein